MKFSMQGESRGQLPKNLSEFSDAISQTKKKLYSEYDALAKNAGENGALVSTEWIINELKQLENNRGHSDLLTRGLMGLFLIWKRD